MPKKIKPIHPGEILREEFLKPLEISGYRIAKDIAVPAIRISQILNAQRAISVDTALRLARYFDTSPEFWLRLQIRYDIENQSDTTLKKICKKIRIFEAQAA
jgi:addiction module HigA family antidote